MMLSERNEMVNLTRITEPADAAIKHYADSLSLHVLALERGWAVTRLLDIGTGAGFPAVPLAVLRPEWHIHAIDGTGKKIQFVREVAEQLDLKNLTAEHAHSSHWTPDLRFDLVTARALESLEAFLPEAARFVVPGGRIVAYKTVPLSVDAKAALQATTPPELRHEEDFDYSLHTGDETIHRVLHVFRRESSKS